MVYFSFHKIKMEITITTGQVFSEMSASYRVGNIKPGTYQIYNCKIKNIQLWIKTHLDQLRAYLM